MRLLLPVCFALLVTTPANAATKGVNLHCGGMPDDVRVQTFDKLAETGTQWVRMDAYTSQLDPVVLERCAQLAHDRGIKVLWVMTGQGNYPQLAAQLAVETQADAFEVWNEQNSKTFWLGTIKQWVELVRQTASAIHAASPGTLVITGGTSHVALEWLTRAYKAGLAQTGYDALGVHPYERGGTTVKNLALLKGLRKLQLRYGDRRPVWLTEIGLTTASSTVQARYLTTTVKDLKSFPFVKAAFWYQATSYGSPNAADSNYALRGPSLLAYARWDQP